MRDVNGIVVSFNEEKGYGSIRGDGVEHFFHCTAIADGTRTIDPGALVTFDVVAGHLGRWEATAVSPPAARPAGPP
jgi:cold shock CspA family protein